MRRWGIIILLLLLNLMSMPASQAASSLFSLSPDLNAPIPVLLGEQAPKIPKQALIDVESVDWRTYKFTGHGRGFEGHALRFLWEFGDGRTADVESPTHHYRDSGRYQVQLSITDITTGYTIKSFPIVIEISFYNIKNYKVWVLIFLILFITFIVLKLLRTARRRREAHIKWSNKTSDHPVLIRRKHKTFMKKPPSI